jgi:glycosyltransferase involved in cell wall biosynthesis
MAAKKKLLLMVDWFQPFYKAGGIIRACTDFVMQMKADYDIFVFTRHCDIDGSGGEKVAPGNEWIEKEGYHIFYASPEQHRYGAVKKMMAGLKPDVIYLHSMYSRFFTVYPLLIQRLHQSNAKVVLLPHGMLHNHALAIKPFKKRVFFAALRLTGIVSRTHFQATDPIEYRNLKKYLKVPDRRITRIPYFVKPEITESAPLNKAAGAETRFIFIARILKIKNLHLVLQALQKVNHPVALTIAGPAEDAAYYEACTKLAARLPAHITVQFTGSVLNTEVPALLAQHHYMILPSQSENFCYSIYEALLAGRPVITSHNTPWAQLFEQQAGWNAGVSDANDIARVINEACGLTGDAYQQFCKGARQYAETYQTRHRLRETYLDMLG